jgi:hypothetical protein
MADNARKTHLALTLDHTAKVRSSDAIKILGKNLPCKVTAVNGQIVTVSFLLNAPPYTLDEVTMPIHTSVYDWHPVQIGDQGEAITGDAYLGGVSGLGGGVANLSQRANLSTLWFVPISNTSWQPPGGDPNKRVIQGPTGARMQDMAGKTVIVVDGSNITLTIPSGGKAIIEGDLQVTGKTTVQDITIQGTETGGGSI